MEKRQFLIRRVSEPVIFQDKPQSLIYFERCLISPPVFPGTLDLTSYLQELHFAAAAGYKTKEEISELAGEVFGSLAIRLIIGQCIFAVRSTKGSRRESRLLKSALSSLEEKINFYSYRTWGVNSHPWGSGLEMQNVAIGMVKALKYLEFAREEDTVLDSELEVGEHLIEFRSEIMRTFEYDFLKEKIIEGIFVITGVQLGENI